MTRNSGRIEPNLVMKRFGLGNGWFTITEEAVSLTIFKEETGLASVCKMLPQGHNDLSFEDDTILIDPDMAPLFRMIANRLDEISKRQK